MAFMSMWGYMGCNRLNNWAHWLFVAASLYFAYLLFIDDEDGESLKQLLTRKIKAYKEAK